MTTQTQLRATQEGSRFFSEKNKLIVCVEYSMAVKASNSDHSFHRGCSKQCTVSRASLRDSPGACKPVSVSISRNDIQLK